MKKNIWSLLQRLHRDENAQVLPMVAVLMIGFMGMAAMVADVGDIYYAYNELSASTQASVLAGAEAISNPTFTTPGGSSSETPQAFAIYYGSETGTDANGVNTHPILTSAGQNVSTTAYLSCNTYVQNNLNISCITYNGSNGATANLIQVVQVAQVKTFFAALFGTPSVTLTATATAARAGVFAPYNIVVIIDTTESMTTTDSNCSNKTRLACALSGIQTLLEELAPCDANVTCSINTTTGVSTPSVDRVALFTFPNISTATVSDDYTGCGKTNPTIEPYTFPSSTPTSSSTYSALSTYYYASPTTPTGANPVQLGTTYSTTTTTSPTTYPVPTTYAITYGLGDADGNGFVSDFKTADAMTTLNTASDIVLAIGGKTSCNGVAAPGGDGTFYAGAIYAATAALAAEQAVNNVPNVIILVSDGDASSTSTNSNLSLSCVEGTTNCAPTSCGTSTNCTPTTGSVANTTWSCSKSGSTTTCKNSSVNKMGSAATCTNSTKTTCSSLGLAVGAYPSIWNQCQQAVTAAQYAVSSGIVSRVYAVAYGSETTGCSQDSTATGSSYTTPCATMAGIASSPNYFYNDPDQSGSGLANCSGSVESGNINDIFEYIAADLSRARLIPNSLYTPTT